MNLSTPQQLLLLQLSKPYRDYLTQHPSDAYNSRTINSLLKIKFIEKYSHNGFLHDAIRLTDDGKRALLDL